MVQTISWRINGQDNIYYVHTDYLGSPLAYTANDGTLVEEHNYDAWGRERDPATWAPLPVGGAGGGLFYRGYTDPRYADDKDMKHTIHSKVQPDISTTHRAPYPTGAEIGLPREKMMVVR